MIHTLKHLYYELRTSEKEVQYIIKELDNHYFYLRKAKKKYGNDQEENGVTRYRDLYPSRGRLKYLQERINVILQRISLPDYTHGSVKGRNNIINAYRHMRNTFFLTIDLKNFFSSITHHQVFRMLRNNNFSPDVAHILTKLVTYKGCLPQGPPSSPIIANLVFVQSGLKLNVIAESHNLTFTSFLDDLTFSSSYDFKFLIPEILNEIQLGGFRLHHKKISYVKGKAEITGILCISNRLTVNSIILNKGRHNPYTYAYIKKVHCFVPMMEMCNSSNGSSKHKKGLQETFPQPSYIFEPFITPSAGF